MNNNTPTYTNDAYGSLKELREAYDLSSLSTGEIKELIKTFRKRRKRYYLGIRQNDC